MPAHLFIVHFPVALMVVGAVADAAGVALGNASARRAAGALIVMGALAAFLAFFTGGGAQLAYETTGAPNPVLETHAQWGGAGVWAVCGAGALRLLWKRRLEGAYGWANLAVAVAAAALVVAITLSGTAVRHGALP